jgi:sortase A
MSYPSRRFIRKRSKLMRITGVTGELLITAGALLGLFLAWHLVWNDTIQGERQSQSAMDLAQQWKAPTPTSPDDTAASAANKPSEDEPPVTVDRKSVV